MHSICIDLVLQLINSNFNIYLYCGDPFCRLSPVAVIGGDIRLFGGGKPPSYHRAVMCLLLLLFYFILSWLLYLAFSASLGAS